MTFADTNVIIDVLDRDCRWFGWSAERLTDASANGGLRVSAVVVAELSRGFLSIDEVRLKLRSMAITIEPLDEESAFVAGKRFQHFRDTRDSADDARVLPDFLIGGHALTARAPLLTRDPRLFRRYFTDLPLITPETHPHG